MFGRTVVLLAILFSLNCAAAYPDRSIRLIVPFAPGGGNDLLARIVGQKINESLGQPVVVDNRTGAGGNIAPEIVAKSEPDGYTLLFVSVSFATNAALHPKLPFNPIKDFSAVGRMARVPQILVANPGFSAKSVSELIAAAKAKPGQINYGSAGAGSATHFAMELFMAMTGITLAHVPYRGTGPALAAVVAGEVPIAFDSVAPMVPHVQNNRLRGLAISSPQRFSSLPDVPTFGEAGMPEYTFGSWYGILAPARTPGAIIELLNREIARIMQLPDVRERIASFGAVPSPPASAREFAQFVGMEIAQWSKVVRERNIRVD